MWPLRSSFLFLKVEIFVAYGLISFVWDFDRILKIKFGFADGFVLSCLYFEFWVLGL